MPRGRGLATSPFSDHVAPRLQRWEGAGGLAHTPNPAFFLLPHHPPAPCMMAKAILPLPPTLASAACLGGAVRWGQRLRTPPSC